MPSPKFLDTVEEYLRINARTLKYHMQQSACNGITNLHNIHVWSFENADAIIWDHFQHLFSLNI